MNNKASAVCQCCGRRSRPVETDRDGEPELFDLARGWSQAPFPARFRHPDGSLGSKYTCPACNARLKRGETLQVCGGGTVRHITETVEGGAA